MTVLVTVNVTTMFTKKAQVKIGSPHPHPAKHKYNQLRTEMQKTGKCK